MDEQTEFAKLFFRQRSKSDTTGIRIDIGAVDLLKTVAERWDTSQVNVVTYLVLQAYLGKVPRPQNGSDTAP